MQDKHESQQLTKVKSSQTLSTQLLLIEKFKYLKQHITLDSSPLKTLLFQLFDEIGLSDREWQNLAFQLGCGHKGTFKQQQSASSLFSNEALDFLFPGTNYEPNEGERVSLKPNTAGLLCMKSS